MIDWAPYAAAALGALALAALVWALRRGAARERAALVAQLSDIDARLRLIADHPPPAPDMSGVEELAAGVRDDLSIMFTYVGKLAGIMGAEADRVIGRIEALEEARPAPPDPAEAEAPAPPDLEDPDELAEAQSEDEPDDQEDLQEPEEIAEVDAPEPLDEAEIEDAAPSPLAALVAEAREALEARLDAMEAAAQARHGAFRVLVESRIETLREMLGDIEMQTAGQGGAGEVPAMGALAALSEAQASGFAAIEAEQARLHAALGAAVPAPLDDLRAELSAIAEALTALRASGAEPDADEDADPGVDLSALLARAADDAQAVAAAQAEAIGAQLDALAARLDHAPDGAPAAEAVIEALEDRFAALGARLDALSAGVDGQAGALVDLSTALAPDRLALMFDQRAEREETAARVARRIVDIAPAAPAKAAEA